MYFVLVHRNDHYTGISKIYPEGRPEPPWPGLQQRDA